MFFYWTFILTSYFDCSIITPFWGVGSISSIEKGKSWKVPAAISVWGFRIVGFSERYLGAENWKVKKVLGSCMHSNLSEGSSHLESLDKEIMFNLSKI